MISANFFHLSPSMYHNQPPTEHLMNSTQIFALIRAKSIGDDEEWFQTLQNKRWGSYGALWDSF